MDEAHGVLSSLVPVILLLGLGVVAAVASRSVGLSTIVGYLLLGLALKVSGLTIVSDSGTITLLAELGVVFLLFDIGLHFSLRHLRQQATDVFGFGPVQVLLAALAFGLGGWAFGLSLLAAAIVGVTLALSSTAVSRRPPSPRRAATAPTSTAPPLASIGAPNATLPRTINGVPTTASSTPSNRWHTAAPEAHMPPTSTIATHTIAITISTSRVKGNMEGRGQQAQLYSRSGGSTRYLIFIPYFKQPFSLLIQRI